MISAVRVVREKPYTEVHVLYGPLGHYLLGWFHVVTGLEISAAGRLFFALNALTGLVLAAALSSQWSGSFSWRVLAVTGLVLVGPMASIASYSGVAVNLLLLGMMLARMATRALNPMALWIASASGILVVTLASVRINFGVYLGAAFGAAFVWMALRQRGWGLLLWYSGSMLAASALVFGIMWKAGILADYVQATLTYVQRFETRTLPPTAALEQPGLLVAAGGLAASSLWVSFIGVEGARRAFLAVLLAGLGSYAWLRLDLVHLYPLLAVLLPLVVSAVPRSAIHAKVRLAGIGCAVILSIASLRPIAGSVYRLAVPDAQRIVESGFALDRGAFGVVAALRARGAGQDEVLVASWPGSCECVSHWCANQAVYLAGGWVPRSPIWIPDTAVTSWPDSQERMIEFLQGSPTRFIAFEAMNSTECADRRVVDPGLLSDWVSRNYHRAAVIADPSAPTSWYLYERKP